jgi:outer membrane receptor protein involved in Fe transport
MKPAQSLQAKTLKKPTLLNQSIKAAIIATVVITAALPFTTLIAAEATLSQQQFQIPAGPLSQSLNQFASQSGITLSFDPALTEGLTSPGISGQYSKQQVMEMLLAGSGLTISQKADGSFTIYKAAPAETNNQIALPAVIVSGEKLNRRLQDTLSSVAVFGQEDIRQHADQDLQNIMARTPGIYTQSGNENWGIRGVPVSGFDSQGAGTMNGAVTVFVDGAAQTHRLVTMNPLRLWDVEQVEVYRGAQSTTQGRNSLAGAVVLKTNDPTFHPEFAAQTNFGSYGEQGVSLVANDSIVDNLLAGRLAVDYQTIDGYIDNLTLDRYGDAQRAVNIRGKLLFQPSEKMDLLLTLDRTEQKRGEYGQC